jgi:aspartyl-tRNA(Asn)/glutamyl-tRNA(Gln) amidotransferase subunit A
MPLAPLHGVPFSVKDLIPTAGVRTTLGSLAHADWIPEEDEVAVARLRAAGGVLLGKTNARELGYGVVTDNERFGPTRNPWNLRLTAAGSSGGAAAAVASGMGSLALGSDGGGSLRVPAAVCGVFAIKPTFGLVPLYPSARVNLRSGLANWESLECIGPITRTVEDSALILQAIAGFDVRDWHSAPVPCTTSTRPDASRAMKLRVAYSADLGVADVNPEVAGIVHRAVTRIAAALDWDLSLVSPDLPSLPELRQTFLATVAMDSNRFELAEIASRFAVSPDIHELIARNWTAEEFDAARELRRRIRQALQAFCSTYDVLLTPTTATTAFPVGRRFPHGEEAGIGDGREWSPFAFLANLTGHPATNMPVGCTSAGLPVGLQAIGSRFSDGLLLDIAQAAEELFPGGTPLVLPGIREEP